MNGYFEYLCNIVDIDDKLFPYKKLARWMLGQEFIVLKQGDANRAADGVDLRKKKFEDCPSGPCTVLEVLIGLSKRMVFMADGIVPYSYNTETCWFEMMIENLGLNKLKDNLWISNGDESANIAKKNVDKWMYREYDYDGTGGLFPLKKPMEDQRNVEIWYQLNHFLTEEMEHL